MRPRPSHFFLLCTISLARAAVFDRGDLSRRDGLLDDVRQMAGGQEGARETVTETIRQTVTVNGAGAQGALNSTATKTVMVPVDGAGSPVVGHGAGGEVNAEQFEGFRISFVTQTVVGQASTVFETLPASTVREQLPAETVVQTVTQQCTPTNLPPASPPATPGNTPGASPPAAPDVVLKPGPNEDGNGIGVTTVPIAESALPQTTLSYDPLATPNPGNGASSPPPAPPAQPATTSSATPAPEPPASNPGSPAGGEQPPAGEEPAAPPDPTAVPAESDSAGREATQTAGAGEPAASEGGEADESGDSDDSDNSDDSGAEESDSDDSEDGEDDEEGEAAPDASAPVDSVVASISEPPETSTSPEPVLPSIDVSSFSLDSQLDLGGLVRRTEDPAAQVTDAP